MRFIRMMKRNTGTRDKMWAGHTAPFFCLQKSATRSPETQKGPQGAFQGTTTQSAFEVCNLPCFAIPLRGIRQRVFFLGDIRPDFRQLCVQLDE